VVTLPPSRHTRQPLLQAGLSSTGIMSLTSPLSIQGEPKVVIALRKKLPTKTNVHNPITLAILVHACFAF